MIHLKDINKTYQGAQPLHVLKGITLDIAEGEFVSIMARRARASLLCSIFSAFSTTTTRANTCSAARSSRTSRRRALQSIATA